MNFSPAFHPRLAINLKPKRVRVFPESSGVFKRVYNNPFRLVDFARMKTSHFGSRKNFAGVPPCFCMVLTMNFGGVRGTLPRTPSAVWHFVHFYGAMPRESLMKSRIAHAA